MSEDESIRIIRVRLFELGHSFEYIDSLSISEIGDILAYWEGKHKAESKAHRFKRK